MNRITGFIIAGTNSGAGKTTVAIGIMAWLKRQGYKVAPFKVGPDFIDPGHHTHITGAVSRNLDGWMLSENYNRQNFEVHCKRADIAIVEGVMGLYDGFSGSSDAGSTAQMAKWLNLPVILVVNAESMARSAAALIKGFVEFDPDLEFAGVVFNNLGNNHHYAYLKEAAESYLKVPVLGGLLRDERISMPERHLGLVTDEEYALSRNDIDRLADLIEKGLNTEVLINGLDSKTSDSMDHELRIEAHSTDLSKVKIGVARDTAFCFYYQDNLDMLTSIGAELIFFSPLDDLKLPENLCGIYLGGGYPELFADRLAQNQAMRQAVKRACEDQMPIYGECGGFMYLCRSFCSNEGHDFPMTGCFPYVTHLRDRFSALGYRETVLTAPTILGPEGTRARGHEFHYSELKVLPLQNEIREVYEVSDRKGQSSSKEGFFVNQTLGSYVHLHFGSNPDICRHFVNACRAYYNR